MIRGIALGGGGAKGFAHVGVLKVFEREGISFDVISGTSIGALVGAVYAAGNIAALEKESTKIKLTETPKLFSPSWSFGGFFSGKNVLEFLSGYIGYDLIEQLPKKFAAVSTDLVSGEMYSFQTGDVRQAIRASISIPALFTPVTIENRILVDGGTVEPVPIETARSLGADFVVAVDLFGGGDDTKKNQTSTKPINSALDYLRGLMDKVRGAPSLDDSSQEALPPRGNLLDITQKTLRVSQRRLTSLRLKEFPADLLIQPDVLDIGLLDFHRGVEAIARGERAAEAALPKIRESLSDKF